MNMDLILKLIHRGHQVIKQRHINNRSLHMKHILLILLLSLSTLAIAVDYKKLGGSVGQDKVAGSVDTQQLKESVGDGEVDYKKAVDSVDKEEATDTVLIRQKKHWLNEKYVCLCMMR